MTQGRATLLITHELDGLDQVDEIVVLDHGRVTERGTHLELLQAGGLYQQMQAAALGQPTSRCPLALRRASRPAGSHPPCRPGWR